jgi:hypothetical protein
MVVAGDVGGGVHEQVVAGHAAERRVNDVSDEDVSGEGNQVHRGMVEAAVGRGDVGFIRDGRERGAKHVEGTRVRLGLGHRDEWEKER